MESMADAKAWGRKYQPFFPNNELFSSLLREEETQPEVKVNAKLEVYFSMLEDKIKQQRK
jgi:hypothetical protein